MRVDELQVKTFLRGLPRRLPLWAEVNRRVTELLAKYPDDPEAQNGQSPDHPLYIQALVGVLNDNGCPADFDAVEGNINAYIRGIQELRADVKSGRIPSVINEKPAKTPAAKMKPPKNWRYRKTKMGFAKLLGVSPQAIQKQIDARNPKYISNILEISGHWYTSPNAVNILKSAIQQNKRNNQT